MKLSPRRRRVLELTVELYLQTAQPVSSSLVSKRMKMLKVSSATVRNEMASLEALGLLYQPHTSAGRLPSAQGLRLYLNQALRPQLQSKDRLALDQIAADTPAPRLAVELGSRISELSKQMTAVVVPHLLLLSLKEFGLVRIDRGRFLVYLVSTAGAVEQRIVEMEFDLAPSEVVHIQNYLNQRLAHLSLGEIRTLLEQELEMEHAKMNRLERSALKIGQQALPAANQVNITIDGTSHLCDQPEFAQTENLQKLLKAIESKTALVNLLNRFLSQGDATIILNSDHDMHELPALNCIGRALRTSYGSDNAPSISVLGPTRMDYGRVVPMVNYASELLERHWLGV